MLGSPGSRNEQWLAAGRAGLRVWGLRFQGGPINRALDKKKRPKLFSSGRLGSPPPELPNHDWIVVWPPSCVNVTLVIDAVLQVIIEMLAKVIDQADQVRVILGANSLSEKGERFYARPAARRLREA